MAGRPSLAGRRTSHTPKSSLRIGVASLLHSSAESLSNCTERLGEGSSTEVAYQIGLNRIRSPLAIGDISIVMNDKSVSLKALDTRQNDDSKDISSILTLLNFSRPPSVSLMVLIQCWARLNLDLKASLNGASHGSSWTTPTDSQP